jgi:hypothetical protein
VVKDLFAELKPSNQPTVVWVVDITDEKGNQKIEGTIFQNEKMGLSLKRFNCFKVNVRNLPEGDLKEEYLRKTGFLFYDPAGKPVLQPLLGKRASSLSTFSPYVEKVFDQSFTMRFDAFVKEMTVVLNKLDAVDIIDKAIAQAQKDGPVTNPRDKRKLEKDIAERDAKKKEVEEYEAEVVAKCTLRPEYLPEASGDETGKAD